MTRELSEDILGRRCKRLSDRGTDYIYTVVGLWVDASIHPSRLRVALMADGGGTITEWFSDLQFAPMVLKGRP